MCSEVVDDKSVLFKTTSYVYYKVKVDKISACWDSEDQEQNWNTRNFIDKGNWPHSVRLGKSEISKKKKGSSGGLVCLYEKSTVDCRGNMILFPIRGKLF